VAGDRTLAIANFSSNDYFFSGCAWGISATAPKCAREARALPSNLAVAMVLQPLRDSGHLRRTLIYFDLGTYPFDFSLLFVQPF
jgi:hypothetical protein